MPITPAEPMSSDDLHLLRVYADVSAIRDGELYWKVLIDRAKAMGLANAAVFQVLEGFGPAALVHRAKAVDLAPGQHVIVEIADTKAALEVFHATLEITDDTGLVTLEAVTVVGYGGDRHHHGSN